MFATERGKLRDSFGVRELQKSEGSVTEAVCRCRADNLVIGKLEPSRFDSRVVEAAVTVYHVMQAKVS